MRNVTLPYGAYDVGGSSCNVVVRASYFGPGVPGSNPGRCTFRCGLDQVTFIPCLVLEAVDGRPTRTDCDEARHYVVPNV